VLIPDTDDISMLINGKIFGASTKKPFLCLALRDLIMILY
jgi:hypothetical protein